MSSLVYEYTEPGYCRVYYSYTVEGKSPAYYCAQEEHPGSILFYRCTDDYHEPMYTLKPKVVPPLSPGNTDIDKAVNAWIAELATRLETA